MQKKNLFFVSIFVLAVFFIGIFIGIVINSKQPSFYRVIKDKIYYGYLNKERVYHHSWMEIKEESTNKLTEFYRLDEFDNLFSKSANASYNFIKNNSKSFREMLFKDFILDPNIVEIKPVTNFEGKENFLFRELIKNKDINLDKDEIYLVKYYDIKSFGVLHKSKNSQKLLIYNQGHSGNSYDFDYFHKIKNFFLKKDYDVLNLNMPIRGLNWLTNANMTFPVNSEYNKYPNFDILFSHPTSRRHEIFSNFYDSKYKNKKPFSVFISGNYYLIKKAIDLNQYSEINVIGHSGGAVMSLYYMNLIPEINKMYYSSGALPKIYSFDNNGDWETYNTSYFSKYNYFDLFFGSLIDQKENSNREVIVQFQINDPVCCSGPPVVSFSEKMVKFSEKNKLKFKSIIRDSSDHKINFSSVIENFN
tara:strand:- start:2765 stop:4018 length:1254 start_codon:yes stop_codon:yes gene_type:complete